MSISPFQIDLDPIELTPKVISFFQPKGIYVHNDISYADLLKTDPFLNNKRRVLAQSTICLPELELKSTDTSIENESTQMSKRAIRQFYSGRISDIERTIIFKTSSEPIKLRFSLDGKCCKETVYVKRPDVNRIIGKTLYNMINGIGEFRFKFNEYAFLEEGIHGNPIVSPRINEQRYLQCEEYKEGIIRAAVHAEFLDLLCDVANPENRLIDTNKQTVLFDFNFMFYKNLNEDKEIIKDVLLQKYFKRKNFFTSKLHDVYIDEQRKVAKRIISNQDDFIKITTIFGELKSPNDPYIKTINQKIQQEFGKPNLTSYLLEKVEEYSRV